MQVRVFLRPVNISSGLISKKKKRYFHRSINVPKLLEVGFCFIPRNMTRARMIRLNAVPDTPSIAGLREMEDKDILPTASLFTRYMRRFGLAPIFDIEDMKHYFLSGKGEGNIGDGGPGRRQGQVTWSFVVEVSMFIIYFTAFHLTSP
jgi:glycylpeptide N-tetradecanoyltransferase